MRGRFAGKSGKITDIKTKYLKIYVDGIVTQKMDKSKVKVALRPSNLLITALNLDDKKRAAKLGTQVEAKKAEKKNSSKKIDADTKEVKKEKSADKLGEKKNE